MYMRRHLPLFFCVKGCVIMQAIVVGATGAVGRDLMSLLVQDGRYQKVLAFTRREVGFEDEKVKNHIVNFENPKGWHDLVQGDVLFSCLGTSLKQAGSQEAQRHIDFDYQMMFARFAKENGVQHLVLVSSVGADAQSRFFYLKLKGEIEDAMQALQFDGLTIIRPPALIRKHTKRWTEGASVKIIKAINALGLCKSQAPIKTEKVAQCMANVGAKKFQGVRYIRGQEILQWL